MDTGLVKVVLRDGRTLTYGNNSVVEIDNQYVVVRDVNGVVKKRFVKAEVLRYTQREDVDTAARTPQVGLTNQEVHALVDALELAGEELAKRLIAQGFTPSENGRWAEWQVLQERLSAQLAEHDPTWEA
jgi:hypothetical protein